MLAGEAAIVVADTSWSIPSLNGFPGGYMKDVAEWFTPEDFIKQVITLKILCGMNSRSGSPRRSDSLRAFKILKTPKWPEKLSPRLTPVSSAALLFGSGAAPEYDQSGAN